MFCYMDPETTGLEKKDRICAVGLIVADGEKIDTFYDLVNPGKKVPPEAMALH
ncbi:MAG TPA: 3'-5' exonuclease, partial [Sulfuricurvum sp.]|nr:3'-5' exonuclease [Sulfuricurvum sp.]